MAVVSAVADRAAVLAAFAATNGSHAMSPDDDAYCREVFTELRDHPILSADDALAGMSSGSLPLPSYVLSDGATLMVYPDFYDTVARADGADGVRAWFLDQWSDDERSIAAQEWDAYRSGRYVCLNQVRPDTIRAKSRLCAEIDDLTHRLDRPDGNPDDDLRIALAAAVDELDRLEPAFTEYDRARFGEPTSRDRMIDDVRRRYLHREQDAP